MKFSTMEIANKVFKKEFYGYSSEEVREYLDAISNYLNQVLTERNALKEQVRLYENQIMDFKQQDQILRETITTASQMSERMKEEARVEAQKIITAAHEKNQKLLSEASENLKKLYQEMTELKKSKQNFESNIKALAKAHIDFINQSSEATAKLSVPVINDKASDKAAATDKSDKSTTVSTVGFKVQPLDFA